MKMIFFILLLSVTLVVLVMALDTEAPTWSNNMTNNTNPKLNETVLFSIGWEDNISLSDYIFSWNITGTWVNDSSKYFKNDSYKENESSASGYGNAYLYINFTKNSSDTSGIWQVKHGLLSTYNVSIPDDCFDTYDTILSFRWYSDVWFVSKSYGDCWNGSDWNTITSVESSANTGTVPSNNGFSYAIDGNYDTYACYSVGTNTWSNSQIGTDGKCKIYESGIFLSSNNSYTLKTISDYLSNTTTTTSFSWLFYSNDTSGNLNQTDIFSLDIAKTIPFINVYITTESGSLSNEINTTITFFDSDLDTWLLNQTEWFKDGIYQSRYDNDTSILSSNLSNGNWTISSRVFDGYNWSLWMNDSIYLDYIPPSWKNNSVNNTYPILNDTIKFVSYWHDLTGFGSYIFSWNITGTWVNDTAYSLDTTANYTCYQHLANVSTACGGLDTGIYDCSNVIDIISNPCSYSMDGDWDTFTYWEGGTYLYINYTIPEYTYGAVWEVKDNTGYSNISLPLDCFNNPTDKLELGVKGDKGGAGNTQYMCRVGNGTELIIYSTGETDGFFEGAVLWNVSGAKIEIEKNISTTKNVSSLSWIVYANDSLGHINFTEVMTIDIEKYAPESNADILEPVSSTDTINCSSTFFDADIDTWRLNQTKWYNNSVEETGLENVTVVGAGNTTGSQTWTCSWRVYDGFNWSLWTNDSVVIGDSTAPTINELYPSSYSSTTSGTVTFTANVTDTTSTVSTSACIFEMQKTDLTPEYFNLTSNAKSGDLVSKTQSMVSYGTGTLQWIGTYCSDDSGNTVYNSTPFNISISSDEQQESGGGGGGISLPPECTVDDDCSEFGLNFFCVSNKCVKLTREDIAYNNLVERGLPETIVTQLLTYSEGICNWDGFCSLNEGENNGNCGTQKFIIDGQNTVIEGDCSPIDLPVGFLTGIIALAGVLIGALYLTRRKR